MRKEMVLRMRSHLLPGKVVVIVSFDPYSHHPRFIHDLLNDLAVFTNHLACDGTNTSKEKYKVLKIIKYIQDYCRKKKSDQTYQLDF